MVPLPDQFLNYIRRWNGEKWEKYPCLADGKVVDAHDPKFWVTQAQAEANVAANISLHGVAFVLTKNDPWFFLDLDNALDANGQWQTWATSIFLSFTGALGEVSSSGNGLHVLGWCRPDQLEDRKRRWDGNKECYTDGRFVALSPGGLSVIGGGEWTGVDWTNQLQAIVPEREHLGELPDGRDPTYTGPEDDDKLIEMMLNSKSVASSFGEASLSDLWNANVEALARKYPAEDDKGGFNHSSADMALMATLAFWTGKDMPRMDRLFRRSGLMRDKYDKRADYRRDTIQKGARLCRRVYDYVKPEKKPVSQTEAYLSIHEMIDYFEGCCYIRDMHRVMIPDGALLKPEQFNATYGGHVFQMISDGTKSTRKAFEAFTENTLHRFPQAKAPAFLPREPSGLITPEGNVNIYVKPNVESRPGDVTPFFQVLAKILPNERDRAVLIAYMAALIQNPGVKVRWAPVVQGVPGNGKTMIASILKYSLGPEYTHEPKTSQLTEKYNGYLEAKLLQIAEEIHMSDRREILDELKPMITNDRIEIRGMQQEKRMIINTSNWFFCTNYQSAVIKTRSDRRYANFFTAQQTSDDLKRDGMTPAFWYEYFNNWLIPEGYAHLNHWFMNYQIPPELNPVGICQTAPDTSSTNAAIQMSVGPVEAEIRDAVESERPGFRGGWISSHAVERVLQDARLRCSRPKMGEILTEMGYVKWGRSPKIIIQEDGQRPVLWRVSQGGTFEEFLAAQGYRG